MKNLLCEVKVEKVSEKIVDQLKKLILEGKLTAGEKLPCERNLIDILGVGRSSLREAIIKLQEMGYLDVKSRGGVYVKPVDSILKLGTNNVTPQEDWHTINQIFEIRRDFEEASAYAAAVKCNQDALNEIITCFEEFKSRKQDPQKLWELDLEFHKSIVRASSNLSRIHENLNILYYSKKFIKPVFDQSDFYEVNFSTVVSQHKSILEAIKVKDADKAKKKMNEHINWTNNYSLIW